MTEEEWLTGDRLQPMVRFACGSIWTRQILAWGGPFLSRRRQRKIRLYLCASCRKQRHIDPRLQVAVEIAERYADGMAERDELKEARQIVHAIIADDIPDWHDPDTLAADLALSWSVLNPDWVESATRGAGWPRMKLEHVAIALLREIFGNPFRPVAISRSLLAWQDSTIPKLAQVIYNERRFEDLPILADALEEAGCDNSDILNHCRSSNEHVRGCWVVDLFLGKT